MLLHQRISIHAPLAGCDSLQRRTARLQSNFNPRTPCGVRLWAVPVGRQSKNFNPRTPCGVRLRQTTSMMRQFYFNPRTPCGVRRELLTKQTAHIYFNPRTPCGVRRRSDVHIISGVEFQSTHPLRGATAKLPKYSRKICAKATKFLQSQTKSGVAACWAKGKQPLFPALRGANLPGKTGTLPVRIR